MDTNNRLRRELFSLLDTAQREPTTQERQGEAALRRVADQYVREAINLFALSCSTHSDLAELERMKARIGPAITRLGDLLVGLSRAPEISPVDQDAARAFALIVKTQQQGDPVFDQAAIGVITAVFLAGLRIGEGT